MSFLKINNNKKVFKIEDIPLSLIKTFIPFIIIKIKKNFFEEILLQRPRKNVKIIEIVKKSLNEKTETLYMCSRQIFELKYSNRLNNGII